MYILLLFSLYILIKNIMGQEDNNYLHLVLFFHYYYQNLNFWTMIVLPNWIHLLILLRFEISFFLLFLFLYLKQNILQMDPKFHNLVSFPCIWFLLYFDPFLFFFHIIVCPNIPWICEISSTERIPTLISVFYVGHNLSPYEKLYLPIIY